MKQPEGRVLAVFFEPSNWLLGAVVGYFHSPLIEGSDFTLFQRPPSIEATKNNFGVFCVFKKIHSIQYRKVENERGDEMWVVELVDKYGLSETVFIRNYAHRVEIPWTTQ